MTNLTFCRNIYMFFMRRASVSSVSAAKSPEIGSVKIAGRRKTDGDAPDFRDGQTEPSQPHVSALPLQNEPREDESTAAFVGL